MKKWYHNHEEIGKNTMKTLLGKKAYLVDVIEDNYPDYLQRDIQIHLTNLPYVKRLEVYLSKRYSDTYKLDSEVSIALDSDNYTVIVSYGYAMAINSSKPAHTTIAYKDFGTPTARKLDVVLKKVDL
jgi:hypothetical protein